MSKYLQTKFGCLSIQTIEKKAHVFKIAYNYFAKQHYLALQHKAYATFPQGSETILRFKNLLCCWVKPFRLTYSGDAFFQAKNLKGIKTILRNKKLRKRIKEISFKV